MLDLGGDSASRQIADCVRLASRAPRVVLWARDEDVMEVLDPGPRPAASCRADPADGLRQELLARQPQRVEE